jgi:hypothetical protein
MSLYRRLHDRFGAAGVTLGVIALILALGGTALAAKGALTGKQKKEVEKIAKKYAGKPGAPGAQGPAGANGKDGAKGDKGDPGTNGTNGTNGTPGTAGAKGKSIEVLTGAAGCGAAGGSTVQVEGEPATAKEVCNGEEGPAGPTETTLPPGKTETGVWGARGPEGLSSLLVFISFPLRLPSEPTFHFIECSFTCTPTPECPSTLVKEPEAAPGQLCVYMTEGLNVNVEVPPSTVGQINPDPRSGKGMRFPSKEEESGETVLGTYAVTAPTS